ncbi:MAG: hypothetical protein IJO59_01690 [Clostridia bacterium]|nr:hypothetical protein [Clostridia bacterium]
MKTRKSTEVTSIRKKLMAAVAMLLVACIMTVSSTYAWFTLSTAPEVKGITTTVGANGNLEIALGEYDTIYGEADPDSDIGDSLDELIERNLTWGNLIDLSDESYGLGNIVLYPTRLNANGTKLSFLSPLKYPQYGADGRITELKTGTLLGKYEQGIGFTGKANPDTAGVSAIGSASSMSEREFAIRNNKAAVASYSTSARNAAITAINVYGGNLARVALNNQGAADDKVIVEADVTLLRNLVTKLQEANDNIGYSIRAALLTFIASENNDKVDNDDAWKIMNNKFASASMEEINTIITTELGGWPAGTDVYYNEYNAIATMLSDALTTLPESGDSTWGVVSDTVGDLLNASSILVCGKTVSEIRDAKALHDTAPEGTDPTEGVTDAYEHVLNQVLGTEGLSFGFANGSGIFSDIAKMTGNYTAYITFPEGLAVESIPIGGLTKPVAVEKTTTAAVPANQTDVTTAVAHANGMLGALGAVANAYVAPGMTAGAVQALTDTFGYVVDFLFRTNATDSYLQLQTDAADRIYDDNGADVTTRGEGSYISFNISEEYTTARIQELMSAVRVVFYENPGDNTLTEADILGVAALDTAAGTSEAGAFKAPLKLKDYTIAADGTVAFTADKADAKLKALTANEPTKVSVLVYLDGDLVDNTMVGIATDMAGSMNLQFSSSAALTPMEYSDLHKPVATP